MLNRASVWLKAFFRWLALEFRLLWMALLVVVLALVIVCWLGANEFHIRFAGLVLQWFGLGTVVCGIRETRKLFGHPSVMQLLREKVSRFPRWRQDAFVHVGLAEGIGVTGSAVVHGHHNIDPAAPVEEQLRVLAQCVARIDERLVQMQGDIDSGLLKHSESLRQEQQLREKGDKHLHTRLETVATGGVYISFIGVVWIAFGLILSTVSPEIAQWVK